MNPWEIGSFLVLAMACSAWEWCRPGWRVDRFAEFRRDILSFAVALLFALAARRVWAGVGDPDASCAVLRAVRELPFVAKLVLGVVLVDFSIYWIHRAQHRFAVGWRTHRWHHSARQMYWLPGFRTSLAHSFVYNVPQTIVPIHVLRLDALEAGIACSIGLFVQFWVHTNARARIGWLKLVFIRPQDHRLHHAADVSRVVNFGFVFSVWDRWFGTYLDGDAVQGDYALGLGEPAGSHAVPRMLLGV